MSHAQGSPPEASNFRVERTEEGLVLSANLRFELSAAVEDALSKGVAMYFVADAVVTRDRWYWYDKQVAQSHRYMRLWYHTLTRRWRLLISPTPIGNAGQSLGQSFETREEALAAIQNFSRWRIADTAEVDPESRHTVEFRFRLDVTQLPRPFQIGAVGQSDWNVSVARTVRLQPDSAK